MIGDMQLIAEIYDILKELAGLSNPQMADVFTSWNQGTWKHFILYLLTFIMLSFSTKYLIFSRSIFLAELESFLIEITATILGKEDDQPPLPSKENDKDESSSEDDAEDHIRYYT